ncbi:hypothetical protein CBOM_07627 [Ceraceosorus bombacis]|uniref:Uncharacterized protein n=1 Tax=Ceraceosorus bombacis TaxID=401625 RepID=A0A0P1BMT8_9BASI|nr:hypothetical protein CBOM_07627 [Ceraceosorus bombacis]
MLAKEDHNDGANDPTFRKESKEELAWRMWARQAFKAEQANGRAVPRVTSTVHAALPCSCPRSGQRSLRATVSDGHGEQCSDLMSHSSRAHC